MTLTLNNAYPLSIIIDMKMPENIRAEFQAYGRTGGHERARRMQPQKRQAVARQAAVRRWTKARFGEQHFAELGMPGGAAIDKGLADLTEGRETIESLLVSLAAPRLRREGVPVPRNTLPDAHDRLYDLLASTHGELAHPRFGAWLRQVVSFADACASARVD